MYNNGYYNSYGRYWTSTPASYGNYNACDFTTSNPSYNDTWARYCGMTIRPVSD